jgi:formylglycine-generating enzyme required for sulfatase activity/tRNA A-37 threonylcarbamoyl transferase component Bud32
VPDQRIGRYELLGQLGQGGMAAVYLARDPYMKRQVAVKVLPQQFTFDPQFRARFEREAEIIANLQDPAIVPVHDYGEHDGQPYIVMRYMSGGSLRDRIAGRPLPLPEVARILQRLAPALDKAHRRGIIHRDLKPDNILFDDEGEPYLSDFGIAKILEDSGAITGTSLIGTPAYMSPEQARAAKNLDGRTDVYSLGVILFQLLSGALPYYADTPMGLAVAHINDPIPNILSVKPDLPAACEALITRALATEREARHATAGDLAKAVAAIVEGQAAPTALEPVEGPAITPPVATGATTPEPFPTPAVSAAKSATPAPTGPPNATAPPTFTATAPTQGPRLGSRPGLWGIGFAALAAGIVLLSLLVLSGGIFVVARILNRATATSAVAPGPATSGPAATERLAGTPGPTARATITEARAVPMVLVPAGPFEMGGDAGISLIECQLLLNPFRPGFHEPCGRDEFADEEPIHTVSLDAYYIDQYEVTNARYAECVAAGACDPPTEEDSYSRGSYYGNSQFDDYPVIDVNWNMATAYCEWRAARLPTEAEWEKAARGTDGRYYPWGNAFDGDRLNFCDGNCPLGWDNPNYDDGHADTSPVGAYLEGASPYDLYDLAGNVAEWVADWYDEKYYADSPAENPPGPSSGPHRVFRGGSFQSYGNLARASARGFISTDYHADFMGFRCARSP